MSEHELNQMQDYEDACMIEGQARYDEWDRLTKQLRNGELEWDDYETACHQVGFEPDTRCEDYGCNDCYPSCETCDGTGGTCANLCPDCEGSGLEDTDITPMERL